MVCTLHIKLCWHHLGRHLGNPAQHHRPASTWPSTGLSGIEPGCVRACFPRIPQGPRDTATPRSSYSARRGVEPSAAPTVGWLAAHIARAVNREDWLGTFWAHPVSTVVNSGESQSMSLRSSAQVWLRDQHSETGSIPGSSTRESWSRRKALASFLFHHIFHLRPAQPEPGVAWLFGRSPRGCSPRSGAATGWPPAPSARRSGTRAFGRATPAAGPVLPLRPAAAR